MNSGSSFLKLRPLTSRTCSYSVWKWMNGTMRTPAIAMSRNLSTSSGGQHDGPSEFPPNNSIRPTAVHNRNPRNLEKLRIGDRPAGWPMEKVGRSFWNKLIFEPSAKHINAKVLHHSGHVPVTTSSKEWCIRKFLYSTKDVSAARAVGRVLAQRCIEMGISELYTAHTEEDRKKEKFDVFLKAFEEAGIALSEPIQYQRPHYLDWDKFDEKGWEVYDDIVVKDFPTNLKK